MDFGECLKAMRKERGLTPKDVADEMLVQQSYISSIEAGKTIPTERFQKLFFLTYARDVVYEESRYELEKERDLLEEYLILEKKKRSQRCLMKAQQKALDGLIDSLIKIAKIINSAGEELPADDQGGLQEV